MLVLSIDHDAARIVIVEHIAILALGLNSRTHLKLTVILQHLTLPLPCPFTLPQHPPIHPARHQVAQARGRVLVLQWVLPRQRFLPRCCLPGELMTGGDRGRFKFKGEDEGGLGLGLKFGAKISHKVTSASKQMLSQRDREFSPLICELQAR